MDKSVKCNRIAKSVLIGNNDKVNVEAVWEIPNYFYNMNNWIEGTYDGYIKLDIGGNQKYLAHQIVQLGCNSTMEIKESEIEELRQMALETEREACIAFVVLNADNQTGEFVLLSLRGLYRTRTHRFELIGEENTMLLSVRKNNVSEWANAMLYGESFEIIDSSSGDCVTEVQDANFDWGGKDMYIEDRTTYVDGTFALRLNDLLEWEKPVM